MLKTIYIGLLLFVLAGQGKLPATLITEDVPKQSFFVETLSPQVFAEMQGVSYHEGAPVEIEDLRVVHVQYVDFEGAEHSGELMVHERVADEVLSIFKELYDKGYPIARMNRIEKYGGDDAASMNADNTSAFNHRQVAGSDKLSLHAYGLAIDINPVENPYITNEGVEPLEGEGYVDRTLNVKGLIKKGDTCYEAFIKRGWQWGGEWKSIKDYQHFQKKYSEIVNP